MVFSIASTLTGLTGFSNLAGLAGLAGLAVLPQTFAMNVSNVLIYSYTAGFRHDSIPTAVASMMARGQDYGINFVNSEEPSDFTDDYLSQFDALLFLDNTDEVLNTTGKEAFQRYLDVGGNFVAVHAASDCLLNFTTMTKTLGSQFEYHPEFQNATMVVQAANPATAGLPQRWRVQDEVYNFNSNPRDIGAVVVLSVDETSYNDTGSHAPEQGDPHPIAWYQEHLKGTNSSNAGRSFYTALGHSNASWQDDTFMGHIFGAITWTLASNTTRAMNPDATVGSLGPEYTPPAPTTTGTGTAQTGSAFTQMGGVATGISLTLAALLTVPLWALHMF